MAKILFVTNIAGSKMKVDFCKGALNAANALNIDFCAVANRNKSTSEQIREDEHTYGVSLLHADISRSPFSKSNIRAYKQIVKWIKQENIDYIHCNTPVGGILGRLAGKKCKVKKVIYQVHGFHFYKGAPKKNWLLYYPVEKWLAHYTDAIITINQEDYQLAKSKFKLRNRGEVYYVPGVGIDTTQFNNNEMSRDDKRSELNIPLDAFVLISVGELNVNKNNGVIVSALEQLKRDNVHYVLCGVGELELSIREQVEKAGLSENVHFLGYRNDVKELYRMADCFVMPSYREGLSRSIMEAMASGLPCVVSKIRGNVDLIKDGVGGFLCDTDDVSAYAEKLNLLASDAELRDKMGKNNLTAVQKFNTETVTNAMYNIYKTEFNDKLE